MSTYYYETKIGKVKIVEDSQCITELSLVDVVDTTEELIETSLLKKAAEELAEYLEGERKTFSLPCNPKGTEFQKKVWSALRKIPYGETRSYQQIAEAIGNTKACRAVGMANNKNPILIVIPCHRVIGKNGSLVGFGCGIELKEKLLKLEKERNGEGNRE